MTEAPVLSTPADAPPTSQLRAVPERRNQSVRFVADVIYTVDGVDYQRRSLALSQDGLHIEDATPPPALQLVAIKIVLAGSTIDAEGYVVSSQAPYGFVVSLEDGVRPEDRELLALTLNGGSRLV